MKLLHLVKSFIKNDNPEAQGKWSLYGRVWREIGQPYWKLLVALVSFVLFLPLARKLIPSHWSREALINHHFKPLFFKGRVQGLKKLSKEDLPLSFGFFLRFSR